MGITAWKDGRFFFETALPERNCRYSWPVKGSARGEAGGRQLRFDGMTGEDEVCGKAHCRGS
ncbi:hypothetical protein [Sphingobacterium sp. 2149]|uniref:hypothetical protein n=1 Tax=Sphingobacterium sp. 2149 TaxID=2817763 RepID=UPI00285831F1|nr:hypothetical protein [Sphingobacterium sp. 2149]MDR6733663.1 hypothetical protein [Sphingobacterium sp. 2149]